MKVKVYPADDGGCGNYRLRFPAEAAAASGADVEIGGGLDTLRFHDGEGVEHVHGLADSAEPGDVVVFQRPLRRVMYELIGALQDAGVAVVVDIDDDFHSVHPDSVAWLDMHPQWLSVGEVEALEKRGQRLTFTHQAVHPAEGRKFYRVEGRVSSSSKAWLRRACERADLVTVSTPALAERYGGHGRVRVLRNCVPERYLDVAVRRGRRSGPTLVGWTGSVATHVGDLEVTEGGVGEAVKDTHARFHVVGTGNGVRSRLDLGEEPSAVGWVDFDQYPAEYARLDVAVVPLAPSPFNRAKSWLKGLEAAAVGVPFIASPVDEYQALEREGAGLLADGPEEWSEAVRGLVADPSRRAELAEAGRAVAARWTYEERWGEWAQAWEDAMVNRREARVGVAA